MIEDLCEVTVTAPDREWLEDLCRQLINVRLASSAHVMHPVYSIYRWQAEVHEATEARAFLRARRANVNTIVDYVVERHPYDVPNITAVPLVAGNPAYLAWIRDETT
jgi:periplasmic divalent cation tolerance protein